LQLVVPATLLIIFVLLYLTFRRIDEAAAERQEAGLELVPDVLEDAIRHGAVLRVRPKAMTVAVIVAGLLPIFWGHGAGSELMSRIAAPMVGGMITAPLLSMLVIPAAYRLMRVRRRQGRTKAATDPLEGTIRIPR
jgi:Cu(I)/Ag(I) efflux system membrane protein CusA/SilA